MQEEILQELFSIPIGLRPTVKIDNIQLYGSHTLDKSFKKAIAKSDSSSFAAEPISSLLDSGKINPCYLNKGIIGVLLWKVLVVHPVKHILAFFAPSTNKIYIIIDNNINMIGHISNTFLGNLTIHETCHMACFSNYSGYFNIFSQDLTNYYSNYFKIVFDLDKIPEKLVKNFAGVLIKSESQENRRPEVIAAAETFLKSLKKYYKGSDTEFNRLKDMYLNLCRAMLEGFTNQTIRMIMNSKEVVAPLYKSYRTTFGLHTRNILHCQEVVTASEVICVYSEVAPHEKILSMLSLIK